jgi:hypothetical protein
MSETRRPWRGPSSDPVAYVRDAGARSGREPARDHLKGFLDLIERRHGEALDAGMRARSSALPLDAASRLRGGCSPHFGIRRIRAREPCPPTPSMPDLLGGRGPWPDLPITLVDEWGGRVEIGALPPIRPAARKPLATAFSTHLGTTHALSSMLLGGAAPLVRIVRPARTCIIRGR